MHVGTKNNYCPDLRIDKWKLKKVDETKCGVKNLIDVEDGTYCLQNSQSEKYLGDFLSSSLNNMTNIIARRNKGTAAMNQIMSIINDICFGPFLFEVFVTLREALFVNSILANSAVWYGVKDKEIRLLEEIDEKLLLRAL